MLALFDAGLLIMLAVSVKSILLALIAATLLHGFRIRNRNIHHRVWCAVLAAMLCLPILQQLTPSIPLPAPLANYLQLPANRDVRQDTAMDVAAPDAASLERLRRDATAQFDRSDDATGRAAAADVERSEKPRPETQFANQFSAVSESDPARSQSSLELAQVAWYSRWRAFVFLAYVLGVLLFLSRFCLGLWMARRLTLNGRRVDFDKPGGYPTFECDAVRVPLTAGIFRPRILLPNDWATWNKELLTCVLQHEQAHIDRRDNLVTAVAEINRCIYWFHPLAWFLRRRLATLAETTCDDMVVDALGDRPRYAQHLLDIASRVSCKNQRVAACGISMARTAQVESRIDAVLDATRPMARRLGWRGTLALTAVVVPLVALMAGLRAADETRTSPNQTFSDAPNVAQDSNGAIAERAPSATPLGTQVPDAQIAPAAPLQRGADLYGDPLPEGAVARLGTTRYRHPGWHKRVAFLPDDATLVVGTSENTVRAWNARSGKLVHEIDHGNHSLLAFCLSPNGRLLATLGNDRNRGKLQIIVWDTESWKERYRHQWAELFRGEAPKSIAFSPAGNHIAIGTADGTVRLLDVALSVELFRRNVLKGDIESMDFSPNGASIAVAGRHGVVVWEFLTQDEPHSLAGLPRGGQVVRFSPDGTLLAVGEDDDHAAKIFDVLTHQILRQLKGKSQFGYYREGLCFSADGQELIVPAGEAHSVERFDVRTGRLVGSFDAGANKPRDAAISGDGRLLACVGGEAAILVWDTQAGQRLTDQFAGHLNVPFEVVFTADGQQVVTGGMDGTIRFWNATTGQQAMVLHHDYWVTGVALSPHGEWLASCSLDDTVRVWDAATGKEKFKHYGHGRFGGNSTMDVAFSPNGDRFFSFGSDMYLRSYSVLSGRILSDHLIRPTGAGSNDDEDGLPRIANDPFGGFGGNSFMLEQPTFTPDARVLLMGGRQNQAIHFIDVESGKERDVFWPEAGLQDYVVSPDGKILATFEGPALLLREFDSKKVIGEFKLPGRYGKDVAFSPNGKLIAFTVSEQASERNYRESFIVVEVASLKQIARIDNVSDAIHAMALSPDGTKLATSGEDATIIVWDLSKFAQLTWHAGNSTSYLASLPGDKDVPPNGTQR